MDDTIKEILRSSGDKISILRLLDNEEKKRSVSILKLSDTRPEPFV